MSYRAIAAALVLEDLSIGQRLAAFSLASFANRQHRAWPSARTAAMRAGLSRRQYLAARAELERRGLIAVERDERRHTASPLVCLVFAEQGPSIEREVNAELFEETLARSPSRGGARVLLAVLAALADADGAVEGLSADELCAAGGLSDRTYRRARTHLLCAGEIELDAAGGGRSRCNCWHVTSLAEEDSPARAGGAAISSPTVGGESPAEPNENPVLNPGQNRIPRPLETPAQTPAKTPASRARAGKESQNQRTTPPDPPEGGQADRVVIVENFVSPHGRHRQRQVDADPAAELSPIASADRDAWAACRELLRQLVGDLMFELWLADLELVAVSRTDGALLISGRPETARWVDRRYGRVLLSLVDRCGRPVRVASDREHQLHAAAPAVLLTPRHAVSPLLCPDHQEVI